MALLVNVLTFKFALRTGRPQFEESQTPAGYSQASATAMTRSGAPSWANESQTPGQIPKDVASMKTAFTVQQSPPTGSATPSLSSCSAVRTRGRMDMEV